MLSVCFFLCFSHALSHGRVCVRWRADVVCIDCHPRCPEYMVYACNASLPVLTCGVCVWVGEL